MSVNRRKITKKELINYINKAKNKINYFIDNFAYVAIINTAISLIIIAILSVTIKHFSPEKKFEIYNEQVPTSIVCEIAEKNENLGNIVLQLSKNNNNFSLLVEKYESISNENERLLVLREMLTSLLSSYYIYETNSSNEDITIGYALTENKTVLGETEEQIIKNEIILTGTFEKAIKILNNSESTSKELETAIESILLSKESPFGTILDKNAVETLSKIKFVRKL